MTAYVALLRAVNVGGTGTLPMTKLVEFCTASGFTQARTYIASGNVVFQSKLAEAAVRTALEHQLQDYAGKPVGVIIRSASEMAETLARNPFADKPGNRTMVLFFDGKIPPHPLDGAAGVKDEQIERGRRELFIFYPNGMAESRLRLPAGKTGTARNMNTVAKLAEMANKV